MNRSARYVVGGVLVSLLLFAGVIVLSQRPSWQSLPEDAALIRLSLRHGGLRECRTATEEELARLPANMRLREICDRRRAPVWVRMDLDGKPLVDRDVPPSGLWGTGPSRLYARFTVPAGRHEIALQLTEDPDRDTRGWELRRAVTITPGENVAIDFDTQAGGFVIYEDGGQDG